MEKELKIAELASIWGVSVPTTWNRIKKMGLSTFIKKSETHKDVTYVSISEEKINEYVINHNNGVFNDNNNPYYKEMLNNNNVINNANNDVNNGLSTLLNQENAINTELYIDKLITVNEEFNNRLERKNDEIIKLYNELMNIESKQLLLEDREKNATSREGLYLSEINQLKKRNKALLSIVITLIMVFTILLTTFITLNYVELTGSKKEDAPPIIEEVAPSPSVQYEINRTTKKK